MRGRADRARAAGFAGRPARRGDRRGAYALAWHRDGDGFVAAAYTIGILMVGALGAFGPRVLRW